jgi:hypothetical protein
MSANSFAATQEELNLQSRCSKTDLSACENLTAYYAKTGQWENTIALGEALCAKDVMNGCTLAGTALLAKEKTKEGISLLTKSCDGFEPFACRSLSRLMKQPGDQVTSYMYSRRACYYGLSESCKTLKKPKETYSPKGLEFLKDVAKDCEDSKSSTCQTRLNSLKECNKILLEKDCLLIPGELSILFRAKLIQESAKLALMNIVASENALKMSSTQKRFSYDLKLVLKDRTPLPSYHYAFGFMKACTNKFEKSKGTESTSLALYKKSYSHLSSRTIKNIAAYFYKGKKDDCYDPKYGLEAYALGNLDPLNTARLDVWKTNGDGDIIQVQDGLPLP